MRPDVGPRIVTPKRRAVPRPDRRRFVQELAGLAVTAAGVPLLAGCDNRVQPVGPVGPEPPPETTRLRLGKVPNPVSICQAPLFLAPEFLTAEGFTDVAYTEVANGPLMTKAVASGEIDIA